MLGRLIYDSLAPLPLLAATAAMTSRVRIGTSILLATLWSPLLLAKELATIRARGRRLEETMALLKQAWGGGPVDHAGRAFQIHVPPTGPRPGRRPNPPLWLGGFALGRELSLVARNRLTRRRRWVRAAS